MCEKLMAAQDKGKIVMIPERYLQTIGPLTGISSMLELGNKRGTGGKADTYKAYFEKRCLRHVSVDWNGHDGALALDLRKPLNLGTFDMVTNIGTSEHVDDQFPCWRNMVEAADLVLVCITPYPADWPGHGLFYPWPSFYVELARDNGFVVESMMVDGEPGRRMVFARMRRVDRPGPFVMPSADLLTAAPSRPPRLRN